MLAGTFWPEPFELFRVFLKGERSLKLELALGWSWSIECREGWKVLPERWLNELEGNVGGFDGGFDAAAPTAVEVVKENSVDFLLFNY